MRILIAIPTKDKIDVETFVSVANLDWDGHEIEYTSAQGMGVYGIAQARNNIVNQAIDNDFDKILMVDSDMILPEDTIKYLLDPDVPIVIGCARYKNDSGRAPIFKYTVDDTGQDSWIWNEIPAGRFDIKSGGLACAMIDTDVFRRISKPYFKWEERANGSYMGEDIWFYEHARQAGYRPQADGRVKCGHIGRKIYD